MKPIERLVESGPESLSAAIREAASERPSTETRKRAFAALGVGGMVGASAITTSTAAAKGAALSLAVKGIAALGAFAVMTVGVAVYVHARHAERTSLAPIATPATANAPPLEPAPEPPPSAVAPEPTATPRVAPPPPVASPMPPASSSLAAEVAAIDAAREALGRGNPDECLRLLGAHDRDYPRGALAQEATTMRVEALLRSGNRAGARALADRFLARNPSSPYAARIRSMLESAHNP